MINSKSIQLKNLIIKLEKNAAKLPLAKISQDIVPPDGNPDAEIFFIGEAAGYHEHLQRKPFVGLAGKLLTRSLEENGLRREDVWISNILKVRPPNNRDPLPEEIAAYKPYLDEEINIIKPKIIVTLGRFSLGKFLPGVFISQVHGQARWIDWDSRKIIIFPMYHPAAALRNGNVMRSFRDDFQKLIKIIDTLNKPSIKENQVSEIKSSTDTPIEDSQLQLI
jgi:DNA polymerase